MKRTLPILIVLLMVIIVYPGPALAQESITGCGLALTPILHEFARWTFPENYYPNMSVEIYAKNDEMCGSKDHMLNVAVILKGITGEENETVYGIYHIHFSASGTIMSAAAVVSWRALNTSIRTDWCAFIRAVYPEQVDAQSCH